MRGRRGGGVGKTINVDHDLGKIYFFSFSTKYFVLISGTIVVISSSHTIVEFSFSPRQFDHEAEKAK